MAWLGAEWGENLFFASDYFEQLYEWALHLIDAGKAFVCELSPEEVREYRGTLKTPGRESPYRNRPVAENRRLFEAMRAGEFPDGAKVLRAKIDMAHPNMNMRDPVLYRIQHAHHHRTGDAWCIYPMYDFAHGQSDAIEGITHSICTLEFEEHRPLYNWFIENLPRAPQAAPNRICAAQSHAHGDVEAEASATRQGGPCGRLGRSPDAHDQWLAAARLYPPAAIREFCARVGGGQAQQTTIDLALLEFCLRQDLETIAPPAHGRARSSQGDDHQLSGGWGGVVPRPKPTPAIPRWANARFPSRARSTSRGKTFWKTRRRNFFRLAPGVEVRLRYACYITCTEVIKDAAGNITELKATFDPESRGGGTPDNRRVKGTIHWVSATENVPPRSAPV